MWVTHPPVWLKCLRLPHTQMKLRRGPFQNSRRFNHLQFLSLLTSRHPQANLQRHTVRKLPSTLKSLHRLAYTKMTTDELEATCKEVFSAGIVVTQKEAVYLEESTKLKSQSTLWFDHRIGRITASKLIPCSQACRPRSRRGTPYLRTVGDQSQLHVACMWNVFYWCRPTSVIWLRF